MTVFPHVHTQTEEFHSFRSQTHALFEASFSGQKYLSVSTDDAMPWKTSSRSVQGPCDLSGCAGVSGSVRNVAVGRHLAAWDTANLREEIGEHGFLHRRNYAM
jgi:hypothetical protein